MSGQRLTTLTSRSLMGMSAAFLAHSILDEYWMVGAIFHAAILLAGCFIFFINEYKPADKSRKEMEKLSRTDWTQQQTVAVTFFTYIGGALPWLI